MTTHSNYSLQNFSTNNAKVLTGNSQPVPDFMALCNQGIISRENISGIDNSNGNLISHEKILGIDNSNLPLENKKDVEVEAKAKEEQLKKKFLLVKVGLKNEHYNLSKYGRLHPEEKMDIKDLQKYIELNLKNTKKFNAMLKSEEDRAVLKGMDSSFWTRTSMLVELVQLSTYARQTAEKRHNKLLSQQMCKTKEEVEAYNIHKSEQVQGMTPQDGKSGEQEQNDEDDRIKSEKPLDITPQNGKSEGQEQDEAYDKYSSISQLDTIIKSKQTRGINEQDGKSEEQDEEYNIIKPEKAQGDQEADKGKPSYEGKNKIKEEVHGNRKLDDESVIAKQGDQGADQGKPSIEEQTNVEEDLQGTEKSTDATKADQEEDQVNPSYKNQTNIEKELQGKPSIEGQNNVEQKIQGNEQSTDTKEADQDKPPNNIEEEPQGNEKLTDAKEADRETDQGKPSNEEDNNIEEELQGNKKPTQDKGGDQDADQAVSPNEGQNNVEEEVQGKMTEVEESTKATKEVQETDQDIDQEEVQDEITEVEESTKLIKEEQETDQDIDQGKSPNEGQNNVEEGVQGKITKVEESTNANEEDQEADQDTDQGKSLNEGQNNNKDEVQGNLPHGESNQEEIYNEVEKDVQDKRSEYGFIDAIITNAEVPTGKIKIKYDTGQPRSLLSRKLAQSLKTCFKCNDSNIAFVNLCIPSMYGFSYIKWHFDTSKDVKDDCILGQDYLMDRNTSPLTLYRLMNLATKGTI